MSLFKKMLKNNIPQNISINKINSCNNNNNHQKIQNAPEQNDLFPPEGKFNWKYTLTDSYHLDKDIERVWTLIKNFEILSFLCDFGNASCINIKGKDTWKEGNEFIGKIYGKFPFNARVNMCLDLPEMKKIEWLFKIHQYLIIKFELFKVTDDDSTVIIKELKFEKEKSKLEAEEKNYKLIENSLFQKINKLLEKEPINLIKYESALINGKMKDIWDIVTDFKKITTIAPNNDLLPNINLRSMKINEKKEASLFYDNEIKYFDVALKYKEEKPNWNKWMIVYDVYLKNSQNANYTVVIQLTKINENESQLIYILKFFELVSNRQFKEITDKQKYLLFSIKDYFENFYSI